MEQRLEKVELGIRDIRKEATVAAEKITDTLEVITKRINCIEKILDRYYEYVQDIEKRLSVHQVDDNRRNAVFSGISGGHVCKCKEETEVDVNE